VNVIATICVLVMEHSTPSLGNYGYASRLPWNSVVLFVGRGERRLVIWGR